MFCKQFLLMLCTLIGAIILSINIQVGLNMHLYDDIRGASSSLRGSTSSYLFLCCSQSYLCIFYLFLTAPWPNFCYFAQVFPHLPHLPPIAPAHAFWLLQWHQGGGGQNACCAAIIKNLHSTVCQLLVGMLGCVPHFLIQCISKPQ